MRTIDKHKLLAVNIIGINYNDPVMNVLRIFRIEIDLVMKKRFQVASRDTWTFTRKKQQKKILKIKIIVDRRLKCCWEIKSLSSSLSSY